MGVLREGWASEMNDGVDEAALVVAMAGQWLRGEPVLGLALVAQLDRERFRVRGLDVDGHPLPKGRTDRVLEGALERFSELPAVGYVAVLGREPGCSAVLVYQGARYEHSWLLLTASRCAVLRLRDVTLTAEDETDLVSARIRSGASVRVALGDVGRLAVRLGRELIGDLGRPPLAQRPDDAELRPVVELSRAAMVEAVRWREPGVPEHRGGPRHVELRFADSSIARLRTDVDGLRSLTGP